MTTLSASKTSFLLQPENNQKLNNLCGPLNQHILQIEEYFNVKISNQSYLFAIHGANTQTYHQIRKLIELLYNNANLPLTEMDINSYIKNADKPSYNTIKTKVKTLSGKTPHQNEYIQALNTATVNFAIGPAGTGKTYLSVAKAVESLENAKVDRLIFVRPAVEAGERLGFLPGDMVEKVQPYLRPIYDALYEFLGLEQVQKLLQNDCIEIAPLAFMRGRTLNNAFIMLDEAQNTTISQMKMFLTRLGYGSKMVITGDITQTDLPGGIQSGLPHAIHIMKNIKDIHVMKFGEKDIVRHNLVAKMIQAYDKETKNK